MQPLPYLPLYVRDFISDPLVLSMTWIQQGIYLRMLMLSWEAGPLPDDTILIGRMIGWRELWWCPGGDQQSRPDRYDECEAISGVLSLCWEQGEQGWVQPRLEAERARGMALSEARSVAGRKGAESKHGKARRLPEQSHSKRVASQAQAQAQEKKETPPTEEQRKSAPADAGPPSAASSGSRSPRKVLKPWEGEIPSQLRGDRFEALWETWLTYRREEKRKPVTQISGNLALKALAGFGLERACAAIEYTIAMGWQGIREAEPQRNGKGQATDFDDDAKRTLRRMGML